ncbi:hypothetical protein OX284_010145 [Flavobacterium sp. SUN046]|uniref:hypothetical protein n=1 Tax=Flavobacterium sp. SUN046 TaxID=3002440 RepID=UPI002DBF3B54|nr:hypothetical protein [Flavobacterium sp. SUN046]MEC4049788.1 hypothetical protein [Flavobacterium sp. SUN046]
MEELEKYLFSNVFMEKKISTTRLATFAQDTLNRFNYLNYENEFDIVITCLKEPIEKFQKEVNKINFSLGLSNEKKLSKVQFVNLFKKIMTEQEDTIALTVGGYDSPAYAEFYPQGADEYKKANRSAIPVLIHRVYTVADANNAQLSPDLLDTLKAFKLFWENNKAGKQLNKVIEESCESSRNEVEIALLLAIHCIAIKYPGKVDFCRSFFDFSLLYEHPKKVKYNFS